MTTPLYCLLFFALWTLVPLAVFVAPVRVGSVLRGEKRARDYAVPSTEGTSDLYQRVMRAHMNCVENLPVFGAVVLIGGVTGYSSAAFDQLAIVYIVARVVQTLVHVGSGRGLAVNVRFAAFAVQATVVVFMGAMLVGHS